jgi:formylglycine-generating enzyme required for sulfatase activity
MVRRRPVVIAIAVWFAAVPGTKTAPLSLLRSDVQFLALIYIEEESERHRLLQFAVAGLGCGEQVAQAEPAVVRPYRVANFDPYALKPEAERALKPLASFRECAKDCPEMIVIPAGSFMMGSLPTEKGRYNDEDDGSGRQHEVVFAKPFAVSQFDVTFADWDACIAVGGCGYYRPLDAGWGRATQPVIYVSWDDCRATIWVRTAAAIRMGSGGR